MKKYYTKYSLLFLLVFPLSCGNEISSSDIEEEIIEKDTIAELKLKNDSILNLDEINSNTVSSKIDFTSSLIGYSYELDYKYSSDSNTDSIINWWNMRLEDIKNGNPKKTYSSGGAGGPNGAEWNTDTDLYFVAFFPFDSRTKINIDEISTQVRVNTKLINNKSIRYQLIEQGVLVDFNLKSEFWYESLREIKPSDYEDLHGKKELADHYSGKHEFVAPPDAGEVFKLDVIIKLRGAQMKISDYFHIAFGE